MRTSLVWLFQTLRRLMNQTEIRIFFDVNLVFHEAEFVRNVDITLQGLEVRDQVRVAIGVLLGEQPVETLGWCLRDLGGNLSYFVMIFWVKVPTRDAQHVF